MTSSAQLTQFLYDLSGEGSGINSGRALVVDAINFDPERVVIFFHLAEDDLALGGKQTDVAETFQLLIRPHLIADDIEELQQDACIALNNALRAKVHEVLQAPEETDV